MNININFGELDQIMNQSSSARCGQKPQKAAGKQFPKKRETKFELKLAKTLPTLDLTPVSLDRRVPNEDLEKECKNKLSTVLDELAAEASTGEDSEPDFALPKLVSLPSLVL